MNFDKLITILQTKNTDLQAYSHLSEDIRDIYLLDGTENKYDAHILYFGYFAQLRGSGLLPPQCILAGSAFDYADDGAHNVAFTTPEKLFSVFNHAKEQILETFHMGNEFASLMGLVSEGHDLKGLVNTAAKKLGNTIVLLDISYKVLACSSIFPITDKLWGDIVKRGYCTYEFVSAIQQIKTVQESPNTSDSFVVTCWATPLRKLCSKIIHGGEQIGYVVMIESETPISSLHFQFLPIFSKAVCELLIHDSSFMSLKSSLYESLLYDLIIGADPKDAAVRIAAANLHFPSELWALVVQPTRYLGKAQMKEYAKSEIKHLFPQAHITFHEEYIAAALPALGENSFLPQQLEGMTEFAEKEHIRIGLSNPFTKAENFAKYYWQARRALVLSSRLTAQEALARYEDYSFYDMLSQIPEDNKLGVYCHPALTRLRLYDHKNGTDLYQTLKFYLNCYCNLKQTAEVLFIHRNTLTYRLERIEQVAGIALADCDIRFLLAASYKIDRFMARDS